MPAEPISAKSAVERLLALSEWLLANDIDMKMPAGMIDPEEAAALITDLERRLAERAGGEPVAQFDLSPKDVETLLNEGLKPEEINGDPDVRSRRVKELLHWFVRLSRREANPKWADAHAYELAYYIATAAAPPVPAAAVTDALDRLEAIIHELAREVAPGGPEDRAWETINTLRAALAQQASGGDTTEGLPDDIRAQGWAVAVHNDYRLNGEAHTFWLFTKGDKAVKGEGKTDAEALNAIRYSLAASPISTEQG